MIPATGKKFRTLIGALTFDFYVSRAINGHFYIARSGDLATTEEDANEIVDRLNRMGIGYQIPMPSDGHHNSWVVEVMPADFPENFA